MPTRLDFTVKITPKDEAWRRADARRRRAYFEQLGAIAFKVKIDELLAGLDKNGEPLAPVLAKSRPDHSLGPPLCPHGGRSRTVRLLQFEPIAGGVRLFWANDWGKVLGYHADGIVGADGEVEPIRDVFGISPDGMASIERQILAWWREQTED